MKYTVVILKRAQKETKKLPARARKDVEDAIISLQFNPFQGKPLQGEFAGHWTLRVWPYRILYTIEQSIVTVTILKVGHRQGVYKK
jgi:mRNA interferase RelE/StbE